MTRIAFVTYSGIRDFKGADMTDSDRMVADILRSQGLGVDPVPWDDETVNWDAYDLLVLRACWNYNECPTRFRQWLQAMNARGIAMLNPVDTVLWNLDKRYLLDLHDQGVPIPETRFLPAQHAVSLQNLMATQHWDRAVVKPAIGLGGYDTWQTSFQESAADQARLEAQLAGTDLMLQRFQAEIATWGEWSLVFIDREYSHAVRKCPAEGDFRVQSWLGGSQEAATPTLRLRRAAQRVLDHIEGDLLYARVDMICTFNSAPILMELELIEPDLFLDYHFDAAYRLASAIRQRV